MNAIKVEWCENFIKARFKKHLAYLGSNAGIERNLMFKMAEDAGLYERGTYGSPFSKALGNVCTVHERCDSDGNFCYHFFRLK